MIWRTEKRKVKYLRDNRINPRKLTEKQKKALRESLWRFNLAEIPAINTDNTIIAGHQRISILREIDPEQEIEVRVPDRQLTEEEVKEYMIRSNKNTGEFDFDLLEKHFAAESLLDWGFEKEELLFMQEHSGENDEPEKSGKKVCNTAPKEYIIIEFDNDDEYYDFLEKHELKEGESLKFKEWKLEF